MKSSILLFIFALIFATVQAASLDTNAARLARGLPPHAPRKLYRTQATAVEQAKRSKPSSKPPPPPGSCSTGPVQCCNDLKDSKDPIVSIIAGLLGIVLGPNVSVGLGCSPLSVIGIGGGSSCSAHTVCCENNSQGGLISIGCIPIIL